MVEISLQRSPNELGARDAADAIIAENYERELSTQEVQDWLAASLRQRQMQEASQPVAASERGQEQSVVRQREVEPHEKQVVANGRFSGRVLHERIAHGGDNSINTAAKSIRTHEHDHHVHRREEKAKRARIKGKHTARVEAEAEAMGRQDFRGGFAAGFKPRGEFANWRDMLSARQGGPGLGIFQH